MVSNSLDEILNDCVDRLQRGETAAMCLARYPEHAAELGPLLESAIRINALRPTPRAAFRAEARLRFQGEVRAHLARRTHAGRWLDSLPSWSRAWAGATAALLLTLGLSTGAVFASTGATPDDPLYALKRAGEQARTTIAFSEASRAQLHLRWADRRGLELVTMAQAGKERHLDRLRQDLIRELELANAHAGISMASVMGTAGEAMTVNEAAPDQSTQSMKAFGVSNSEPAFRASEAQGVYSAQTGPGAAAQAPASAPAMPNATVPTARPTPAFQPENRGQQEFLEKARQVNETNAARLKLAQRNVAPQAREVLDRVLEFVDAHQSTGNVPGDWAQRVLLVRGTVVMKDKTLWIGERKVQKARGARERGKPEHGQTIVVGGLLQPDGSVLALEIDAREKDREDPSRIVVQGPVVLDGSQNVTVGGYRIKVAHTQSKVFGNLKNGNWVLVDGEVEGPRDIRASVVRPLDGAPTRFDDGDKED